MRPFRGMGRKERSSAVWRCLLDLEVVPEVSFLLRFISMIYYVRYAQCT